MRIAHRHLYCTVSHQLRNSANSRHRLCDRKLSPSQHPGTQLPRRYLAGTRGRAPSEHRRSYPCRLGAKTPTDNAACVGLTLTFHSSSVSEQPRLSGFPSRDSPIETRPKGGHTNCGTALKRTFVSFTVRSSECEKTSGKMETSSTRRRSRAPLFIDSPDKEPNCMPRSSCGQWSARTRRQSSSL